MDLWFDQDDSIYSQETPAMINSQTALINGIADINILESQTYDIFDSSLHSLIEPARMDFARLDEHQDQQQSDMKISNLSQMTQNFSIGRLENSYPRKRLKPGRKSASSMVSKGTTAVNADSNLGINIEGLLRRLGNLDDPVEIFKSFKSTELKVMLKHFRPETNPQAFNKPCLCRLLAQRRQVPATSSSMSVPTPRPALDSSATPTSNWRLSSISHVQATPLASNFVTEQPTCSSTSAGSSSQLSLHESSVYINNDPSSWNLCEISDANFLSTGMTARQDWQPCSDG
jgi:hypothetical protein